MKQPIIKSCTFMPDPLNDDLSWYLLVEGDDQPSHTTGGPQPFALFLFGIAIAVVVHSFFHQWLLFWIIVVAFGLISCALFMRQAKG